MSAPTPPPTPPPPRRSPVSGAVPGDPVREHPHAEPTLYPLVLRTWAFAWWRPVVGLVIMVLSALIVLPLVLMPLLAIGIALQGGNFEHEFNAALEQTKITPAAMLYLNLTLAGLVLVSWLVVRFVHRLRPRWLMSVRPGIRWRFFFVCVGLSIVAIVAQLIVGSFLPGDVDAAGSHLVHWTGETYALALVVLFTTPLQAMGEEYAFRGYAMQAFGSLTAALGRRWDAARRERWGVAVAIIASAGLFALAHGTQNFPLFFDRFAFGLLAGYLVYRTGGLEAGIALHIWNNLIAFGFGIAYGEVQSQLTETSASWWNLPITITQNGIYLILVLLVAKKMGLDNRTRPPSAVLADQTPAV